MKPMDIFDKKILSIENAGKFLSKDEFEIFEAIPVERRNSLLKGLLEKPISEFTEINELFFRSKWGKFFEINYGQKPISVLEVASGDADMIPQTLSRSNPKSKYITANMNKSLNESLTNKIKDLNLEFKLIENDASEIKNYINSNSIDVIAFQHGVNDVLQAILCNKHNIDTVYSDWIKTLPKMIEILQEEIENNSFEISVKNPFLNLLDNLSYVLKEDGIIAINHYMFQLDLDWGYPQNLFENLILIIRKWIKSTNKFKEIFFDSFDSQWWLFIQCVK